MNLDIRKLAEKKLVGKRLQMSIAKNHTAYLWQSFMPERKTIYNKLSDHLFSVEVYPGPESFKTFNPQAMYTKWAAVEVQDFSQVPDSMQTLVIPEGLYAVFTYRGKPSEVAAFYQNVLTQLIPSSDYELDDRPHFAEMSQKYTGEHPDSEEELWFPVREKKS